MDVEVSGMCDEQLCVNAFYLGAVIALVITGSNFDCIFLRYFLSRRKVKQVLMAKRKTKRRQRKAISPKRIKEKIAKNQILLKQATIYPQKSSLPWKNIKKFSLSLGYILYRQLQV